MTAGQLCLGSWLILGCFSAQAIDRLPELGVAVDETTVSGLSSGAFMAVQLHLAHSAIVRGAGVLAGGPWHCAEGSAVQATGECMKGDPDIAPLAAAAERAAAVGAIDALSGLRRGRVWLLSGYNDGVVRPSVMNRLAEFYRTWLPDSAIFYRNDLRAGHAMVTESAGGPCDVTGGAFIADCDYDAAGSLLQFLHGGLHPPSPRPSGRLVRFEQTGFISGWSRSIAMADEGFAYVPVTCDKGEPCRVHVALHGCEQSAEKIGDRFVTTAGYNRWADTNRIVVLYPQARSTWGLPWNPYGCWDWWGYTGEDYATKHAPQIVAIRAMIDRLAAPATRATASPPAGAPSPSVADVSTTSVALAWDPAMLEGTLEITATSPSGTAREWRQPTRSGSVSLTGLLPDTAHAIEVRIGTTTFRLEARTRPVPTACDPWFGSNVDHVNAGRAYVLWGRTYAAGSNVDLGWWNVFTTALLHRVPGGFAPGACP